METTTLNICDEWSCFTHILDYKPIKNTATFNRAESFTNFYKTCEKLLDDYETFAVSISGGVDSMLLSYYCSAYAKISHKKLKLIHINYNNRESCALEVKFLEKWSKIIDAELFVKEMKIVRNRSSKVREEYEKVTKEIRFNFYKSFDCPVLLGHNKDDCYENVFANLSKQIHFENLFGMTYKSSDFDVTIIRPFLEIPKKDIIEKADKLYIPYLEDSTPAWSVRGKMRDSLIPTIQNFNSNILKGFDEYIKTTKFLEKYWKKNFDEWRETEVIDIENKVTINCSNSFYKESYGQISFWINLWFTFNKPTRPSNKSFKQLIEKLQHSYEKKYVYVLSKNVDIEISKEKLVINFK